MNRFYLAAACAALIALPLAADAGVSVSIGQPGFYGHIDIGGLPPPEVIYPQPVIIQPGVVQEPLYLRVPPRHASHWRQYCGRYGACGRPVYFVQDTWYNNVYVPHYREQGGRHEGKHTQHHQEHGHGQEHGNH